MNSLSNGSILSCKRDIHFTMRLNQVAPDIALHGLTHIERDELCDWHEIGRGGFGIVWRAV